jgi:hypothetical protein
MHNTAMTCIGIPLCFQIAGRFLLPEIPRGNCGKPLFSPSVITIQELFGSMSSCRLADKIEMLVMLYDHFGEISGSDESFDDFLYWGRCC